MKSNTARDTQLCLKFARGLFLRKEQTKRVEKIQRDDVLRGGGK